MRGVAGKTVLIAGGAGGIGRAVARRYGEAGARVAILDRDEAALAAAAAELASQNVAAETYCADVTDADACVEVVRRFRDVMGRIDVLVYSAGLTQISRAEVTEVDVYRRVMEVNFFGAVNLVQAMLPSLVAARGQVIAMSSIAGFAPLWGRTGYCASKYALHGYLESLRSELKPRGVAVTIVCPSFVDTEFARRGLRGDGSLRESGRATRGRLLSPDDVARAIVRATVSRRRLVVIPAAGKLAYVLARWAPRVYEWAMLRQYGEVDDENSSDDESA